MAVLYRIGDILYLVIFYIIGYRRPIVLTNLKTAFPEKSQTEIREIARQFYKRFMEFTLETLKALTISEKELISRVKFTNVEDVEPYAYSQQSILVLASHQFNWEWALLAGCIELPFPVDAVYKRLNNTSFDRLMRSTRSRFGGKPIEKSNVLRTVLKSPDRLRALGIVADQSPRKKSPKFWTHFLNRETAFFLGAEQIAKVAKYPVFFFQVIRVKRGYYEVKLVKLAEPPYAKDDHEILERYARATEELVGEDPAGYLWSHKRWKLKREE